MNDVLGNVRIMTKDSEHHSGSLSAREDRNVGGLEEVLFGGTRVERYGAGRD